MAKPAAGKDGAQRISKAIEDALAVMEKAGYQVDEMVTEEKAETNSEVDEKESEAEDLEALETDNR